MNFIKNSLIYIFSVLPLLIYMDLVMDIVFTRDFSNMTILGFAMCLGALVSISNLAEK